MTALSGYPGPERAFGEVHAQDLLLEPGPADDKYSRGVLGMLTGSARFPGAAVLGVEAALRMGVGMVRYLVPDQAPRTLVLSRRPEVVAEPGRVQAWLIGSGTRADDRGEAGPGEAGSEAAGLLDSARRSALGSGLPCVLDAGALELVREAQGPVVLTPHAGELTRLLDALGVDGPRPGAAPAVEVAAAAADALGAVVLLKGSVTHVATPGGWATAVGPASPWLATAGTGDVLAGILGALVAAHAAVRTLRMEDLGPLAATAAVVHGMAARVASAGAPLLALELAEAVTPALRELLGARRRSGAGAGAGGTRA